MKLSRFFGACCLAAAALTVSTGAQAQHYDGDRWHDEDRYRDSGHYEHGGWDHGEGGGWQHREYREAYPAYGYTYRPAYRTYYHRPTYRVYRRVVRTAYARPWHRCWTEWRHGYKLRVCR